MEKVADLSFLQTFTGGDPEKMKKYINMFLSGAGPLLEAIQTNLQNQEWPALRTSAHSLKSQVKYMGIKKAEELAYFIEQSAGNQSNLDQIPQSVIDLKAVSEQAFSELREFLSTI